MDTDPVCGMEVNKLEAPASSAYMGDQFYFCSLSCKEVFDKDPERYAGVAEERGRR